ncbi:flagellar basal body rod protein FlgG [Halalkalibacillus sediminis]|uniref:Flagellar hook protein FlgE n=1 Tax=Halalkalibacillus sediminis TaxID=2018042 RepID=A0A2I0QWA4_9BACI|nr:flagellar basal body rod protein FlgG [Halalkalibacillus sediminis]PKR78626.1 flagellar basal body rod protein FlgG [Halalkalibacillus sediminis]
MLRSMYTGISGMSGFQNKLDVVSNNIANVNTFGYKKGRMTFSDLMSQTMQGATGPVEDGAGNATLGGRNPMQVGLGTSTGSIDNIHTQGNRQTTNRPLDLAIEGDGMFIVAEDSDGTAGLDLDTDAKAYTRAGNFYLDNDGNVVNANGQFLVGIEADANGEPVPDSESILNVDSEAESFSIGNDGSLSYVPSGGGDPIVAGFVALAKFSNPEGLNKAGGNTFTLTPNAGLVNELNAPGESGTGSLFAGALEMSNVDLANEFTEMITAQRGFQANTRVITTSDEILQELVNLKR